MSFLYITRCLVCSTFLPSINNQNVLELQNRHKIIFKHKNGQLEAQVGQKWLIWIRLIMICYIVPWWPSWLSDQIAFSNSESSVVWSFKIATMAIILDTGTEWFSNSESPFHPDASHQVSAQPDTVWEEMWFQEFQDGSHLGHWNRRILAILNLHITPMPPIMFKLNQTYPSTADVISRWLPWWPSWISERYHFSNSKSSCCPDAFHQVSPPSNLLFGSR